MKSYEESFRKGIMKAAELTLGKGWINECHCCEDYICSMCLIKSYLTEENVKRLKNESRIETKRREKMDSCKPI
jgi:hypothetical protein